LFDGNHLERCSPNLHIVKSQKNVSRSSEGRRQPWAHTPRRAPQSTQPYSPDDAGQPATASMSPTRSGCSPTRPRWEADANRLGPPTCSLSPPPLGPHGYISRRFRARERCRPSQLKRRGSARGRKAACPTLFEPPPPPVGWRGWHALFCAHSRPLVNCARKGRGTASPHDPPPPPLHRAHTTVAAARSRPAVPACGPPRRRRGGREWGEVSAASPAPDA